MPTPKTTPTGGEKERKQGDIKRVRGQINIDYSVQCPHCFNELDDIWDKEWFNETMGADFPVDDGYNQTFGAKCPKCNKEFIIDHFIY